MNNGHMLAAAAAQAQGGPPQINVAQPINDVQLVALVAAHAGGDSPREAVAIAVEIVAEAIVQTKGGQALVDRARAILRERALEA